MFVGRHGLLVCRRSERNPAAQDQERRLAGCLVLGEPLADFEHDDGLAREAVVATDERVRAASLGDCSALAMCYSTASCTEIGFIEPFLASSVRRSPRPRATR